MAAATTVVRMTSVAPRDGSEIFNATITCSVYLC